MKNPSFLVLILKIYRLIIKMRLKERVIEKKSKPVTWLYNNRLHVKHMKIKRKEVAVTLFVPFLNLLVPLKIPWVAL